MNRRKFTQSLGLLALTPLAMKLNQLHKLNDDLESTEKMPMLFVGHGNPMNAISDNSITKGWKAVADSLTTAPKAILCISAHWETKGTFVTAMDKPRTIHDFYGFPQALFDVQYPSPGDPELATNIKGLVTHTTVNLDHEWGLDHGTWSVLVKMFPEADIPVLQLSLDYSQGPQFHYNLAKELTTLREKGVLIVGSGNVVHNLRMARFDPDPQPYDWAVEFDAKVKQLITDRCHPELIAYDKLGTSALLSIPTPEHYLPLLYILGLQRASEEIQFFNEEMAFGSGSMRSVLIK